MHRTANIPTATIPSSDASGSSYPTIPSSYFGDNATMGNDTATTYSSSDIRHNNRAERELHQAIRDSIVAERILDRQARKKYPLTQEEKEEQRLAKRQWEISNATLKRIAQEQEALVQMVARQRITEMSEKKRMEMHPRMQQALAETYTSSNGRTGGLVQQVFTENTPDISDFLKQQEDALKTVRRKLRHQQPPAEAWEWEQHAPSPQQQHQVRQQAPRTRDRVGAYAIPSVVAHSNPKAEPTEEDLAAFVRLQEREYRAIQRRIYEQRQQEREQRQSSPAMSYPQSSPRTPINEAHHQRSTTPVTQESYDRYVERQNRELQKLANLKLGPSPKNIPAAASKPSRSVASASPTNSDLAVASFICGSGSVSGQSEASLDDFIQEQRKALQSFSGHPQQPQQQPRLKEPPSVSRLTVPDLPQTTTAPRLKQAPLETTHLQPLPPSHHKLKQPPPTAVYASKSIKSPPSLFAKNDQAIYVSSNGVEESATILKVHLDDELVPYYDIRLHSGKEKQTDDAHLRPVGGVKPAPQSSHSSVAPVQPSRPVRRQSSSSSTKPRPMLSDDEVSLPPPPRKLSSHFRNPFSGSKSNRSSLTQRLKTPAPPLPMTFQKRPRSPKKKASPPPRLVYEQAARMSQHYPQYESLQPKKPEQQKQQQEPQEIPNNSISTKGAPPSVATLPDNTISGHSIYSYNHGYREDGSSLSKSIPSAPHLADLNSPNNYSVDKSLPSAMTDINSMMVPEIEEPTVYKDTYSEDDDVEYIEEVIEDEDEEYVEEEVEEEDEQDANNMNIIRSSLGMNDQSCCLRHPNQLICEYSPSFRFDLVNTCKVCASERQAGSSQSTSSLGASKELAKVIGDIQQLQSEKSQWSKKTNLKIHDGKDGSSSVQTPTKDNKVVPLLEGDWKDQVFRRVEQVQSWEKVTALKYNPRSSRFFRMLKMGVPMGAVQIECDMEGYDPAILKFDSERSLKEQLYEHYPNDPDTRANLLLKYDQGSLLEDCTTEEVVDVVKDAFEIAYAKNQEKKARKNKRKREPKTPPPRSDSTRGVAVDESIRRLEQEKANALSKADDASKRRRIEVEARLRAEEELRAVRQAEKEAREQVDENAEEIIILTQAQMLMREKAEDASRRRRAEMDARLQVEEELQLLKQDESKRLQEQETMAKEVQRLRKAEVEARLKAQDSSVRRRAEMEARLKAEKELRQVQEMSTSTPDMQHVSEELERLREVEAIAKKKAEESSIRRRAELDARLKAEEELRRMENLDSKQKFELEQNEREIKRLKEAEESAKKKAEDSSIRRRREVEARIKAEDELKKLAALESETQKEVGALAAQLQQLQKAESEAREKAVEAIRSRREETDARKKLEEELEVMKKNEATTKKEAEKNAKKLKKEKSALKDLKKKHDHRLKEIDAEKKEAEARAKQLEDEKASLEAKLKADASEHSASVRAREIEATHRHEAEEAIQIMMAEQEKQLQVEIQARTEAEQRATVLEQEKETVEKRLAFQENARRAVENEVTQLRAREQDRVQAVKRAQKKLSALEKEKASVAQKLKLEVQARKIAEEEAAKLKSSDGERESAIRMREEQAVKAAQHQHELEMLRLQDELKKEEQARLEADMARQAAEEEVRQKGIQDLKSKSEASKVLQREKEAREKLENEAKRLRKEAERARGMIAVSEAAEDEVRQRLEEEKKAKLEAETRLKDEVELREKAESEAEILKARVVEESAERLRSVVESKRRDLDTTGKGVENESRDLPYPESLPASSGHYSDASWEEMEVEESQSDTTEEELQLVAEHEFVEEEFVITSDTSEMAILEEIVEIDSIDSDDVDDMQASLGAAEASAEGGGSSSPSLDYKPLSDARYRQELIDTEFEKFIREAEENELEEEIEPEAVEALRIASNTLAYRKKYYNSTEDRYVFYPSIRRLLIQYTLIEKAEQHFYEEEDEFPIEYSAALRAIACEATGEDDSENEEMEQFGVDIVFQDAATSDLAEAEFEIVENLSEVSNDEDMEEVEIIPPAAPQQDQEQESDEKAEEPPKRARPSPIFQKVKSWRNPFE